MIKKNGFETWYFWILRLWLLGIFMSVLRECMQNPPVPFLPDPLKAKNCLRQHSFVSMNTSNAGRNGKAVLCVRLWLLGIYVLRECMQIRSLLWVWVSYVGGRM